MSNGVTAEATEPQRRKFLRNATLGAVGATLATALPASRASAEELDCRVPAALLADRQAFEIFCRNFFNAFDTLQVDATLAFYADNGVQEDQTLGDLSGVVGGVPQPVCGLAPKSSIAIAFNKLFEKFRASPGPGNVSKFIHATGSMKFGGGVDFRSMPGTFRTSGYDLLGYLDIRDGKVFRRTDVWDTAEVSAADIDAIHTGNVPKLSCLAGPEPGDIANASLGMLNFTRALHEALSSGEVGRVLQFFDDSATLIHPLLRTDASATLDADSGSYGPFNRGIQIQGRSAIARFFKAVLPLLPDGRSSSLVHVVGAETGGAFEWRGGGIYAQQGIARNGIGGATAVDLFAGRITRMSVKFDTLQMGAEQRAAVKHALAGECLV